MHGYVILQRISDFYRAVGLSADRFMKFLADLADVNVKRGDKLNVRWMVRAPLRPIKLVPWSVWLLTLPCVARLIVRCKRVSKPVIR